MSLCILPNSLRFTKEDVVSMLSRYGFESSVLPWYPTALLVYTTKDQLTHIPEFTEGYFYLQNASSFLPVIALDPQPGEKILDLAAAPGGKTIHTAIRMKNSGEIIANDLSAGRVARMRRQFETYGVACAKSTLIPGQRIWMKYPNYFDRVLLDAPCSMHGTDTLSTDSPVKMARLQRWLLRSAISACRPGGIIVYSTCTTAVEENEEVIDWILRKDAGKVTVEPFVISSGVERSPGLLPTLVPTHNTTASGIPLHPSVINCVRFAKTDEFEGFFVAKMKRAE